MARVGELTPRRRTPRAGPVTLDVHFGRAAQTVSVTRTKAGPRRDIMRGGDLRAELRGGWAVSRATREGWSHAGEGRSLCLEGGAT